MALAFPYRHQAHSLTFLSAPQALHTGAPTSSVMMGRDSHLRELAPLQAAVRKNVKGYKHNRSLDSKGCDVRDN